MSAYSDYILADAPLLYARLGGTTSTEALADSSGAGRNGSSVHGTPTYGQPSLVTSDAVDLSTQFASSGLIWSSPTWANVTSVTIEAWVRPTTLSAAEVIVERDHSTGRLFQFRLNGSKLEFIWWTTVTGPTTIVSNTTFVINTTYHVAVTYDATNGTAKLYVNGVFDKSSTVSAASLQTGTNALTIGFGYGGTGTATAFFPGRIDEVAYYDKVLSAGRIHGHYMVGTTGAPTMPTQKVAAVEELAAQSISAAPIQKVSAVEALATQSVNTVPVQKVPVVELLAVEPHVSTDTQYFDAVEIHVLSDDNIPWLLDSFETHVLSSLETISATNDCWVWDGATAIPASSFVWNGTTEVPSAISVQA